MKRLLANANQVTAHSVVNDPLLSDIGQLSVNFKNANTRCDYN